MHRHVIIEGPDGAGKTTLARAICKQLKMRYHHEGPPPLGVSAFEHYARLIGGAQWPTVFDRLYLGEMVYGSLYRGDPRINVDHVNLFNRWLRGSGSIIVYCRPPLETCLEQIRARKDEVEREVHVTAYQLWDELMRSQRVNVRRYDFTRMSTLPVGFLPDPLPPGIIGSRIATHLLVGEMPNGQLDLPFFSDKGCSRYLNYAIVAAGLNESQLAFTNARYPDGSPRTFSPSQFAQLPHLRRIVALGKIAQTWAETALVEEHVSVVPLPHPSYWKRFHSHEFNSYVQLLKGACS